MPIDKKIQDNISVPIIGAPLFLVSGPDLVIAQCKAGIIGSFPALNARPQHVLDEWIVRIKTELAEYKEANPDKKVAPFAVNQICHGSNDRLMDDMMTCVKHEVPIIITSLRPPAEVVEAGTRNNIIPEDSLIMGTIRTFDPVLRKQIYAEIEQIAEGVALGTGTDITVEFDVGGFYPVTYNEPSLVESMIPSLEEASPNKLYELSLIHI